MSPEEVSKFTAPLAGTTIEYQTSAPLYEAHPGAGASESEAPTVVPKVLTHSLFTVKGTAPHASSLAGGIIPTHSQSSEIWSLTVFGLASSHASPKLASNAGQSKASHVKETPYVVAVL